MIYNARDKMYNMFVESGKSKMYYEITDLCVNLILMEHNTKTNFMKIKLNLRESGKGGRVYYYTQGKVNIKYKGIRGRLLDEIKGFSEFQVEGIPGSKIYEDLNINWDKNKE